MMRTIVACLVAVLAVGAMPAASYGQQDTTKRKAVPKLDADALRLPDGIHDTQVKKIDRPNKSLPPQAPPNKLDLGTYDLEFRAKHSSDVNPRTGFDSGEKSNLMNSTPGRKSDPALPNYFGLKLSTPTN